MAYKIRYTARKNWALFVNGMVSAVIAAGGYHLMISLLKVTNQILQSTAWYLPLARACGEIISGQG